MSLFDRKQTLKEFALIVSDHLQRAGFDVTLVGGACVTIYSENKYQSKDLDFISPDEHKRIAEKMVDLGFHNKGKDFFHKDSSFTVEFPGTRLAIGNQTMKAEGEIVDGQRCLKLLSPTQCVMDRLAAFYHWKDRQALDQAVMVGVKYQIDLRTIEEWSEGKQSPDRYAIFLARLKTERVKKRLDS